MQAGSIEVGAPLSSSTGARWGARRDVRELGVTVQKVQGPALGPLGAIQTEGQPVDRMTVDLTGGEARLALVDAGTYLRPRGLYERRVKPALDWMGALLLLLLTLPLMAASAVAIRLTMGAPVLLRQPRVGRFGRVFTIYKFRTMLPDRREGRAAYEGPERRISHKRADDPRITPVGRFLRKWSLDELPQFFNVLKGDMSLIGPRPELVPIVAAYEPWQHGRHAVKPGITGLWQVSERGDRLLHEATDVDLAYIERLGPISDLQILLHTPLAALGLRHGH